MKISKIFLASLLVLFILGVTVIVVAKLNIKHLNYDEYLNTSLYYLLPEKEYKDMYELDKINIHNSIENLNSLSNDTEAILIITPQKDPEFLGQGIINNCKIKKVIKGEGFKKNQIIQIYDFVAWWKMSDTAYLNGSTPLKNNTDYIVFIKKATHSNKNNTYIYSSIPYGKINISDDIQVLRNYDEANISVKKAMNYQYIFSSETDDELIDIYIKNCAKLIDEYK